MTVDAGEALKKLLRVPQQMTLKIAAIPRQLGVVRYETINSIAGMHQVCRSKISHATDGFCGSNRELHSPLRPMNKNRMDLFSVALARSGIELID
jgi:hypothetical protein